MTTHNVIPEQKIELRFATLKDVDAILTLHYKYQVDTISAEDKSDGFINTAFTKEQLTLLDRG
jgi:hypothetical protein